MKHIRSFLVIACGKGFACELSSSDKKIKEVGRLYLDYIRVVALKEEQANGRKVP